MGVLKTFVQYTYLFIINYISSDSFVNLVRNPPVGMSNSEHCKFVGDKAMREMYSDLFTSLNHHLLKEDMMKLKIELSDKEALMNEFMKRNVVLLGGLLPPEFGSSESSTNNNTSDKMTNHEICSGIKVSILNGLSEFITHEDFKWTEGAYSLVRYCNQLYDITEKNCDEIVGDMKDPRSEEIWKRFNNMIEKLMSLGAGNNNEVDQNSLALSSEEMFNRAFSLFKCFIDLLAKYDSM